MPLAPLSLLSLPSVLQFYALPLQSETVNDFHLLTMFSGGETNFNEFCSDWLPATMALKCGGQLMCSLVCLFSSISPEPGPVFRKHICHLFYVSLALHCLLSKLCLCRSLVKPCSLGSWTVQQTDRQHMNVATSGLNLPRGRSSEKYVGQVLYLLLTVRGPGSIFLHNRVGSFCGIPNEASRTTEKECLTTKRKIKSFLHL